MAGELAQGLEKVFVPFSAMLRYISLVFVQYKTVCFGSKWSNDYWHMQRSFVGRRVISAAGDSRPPVRSNDALGTCCATFVPRHLSSRRPRRSAALPCVATSHLRAFHFRSTETLKKRLVSRKAASERSSERAQPSASSDALPRSE